jgi:hypothetical protein
MSTTPAAAPLSTASAAAKPPKLSFSGKKNSKDQGEKEDNTPSQAFVPSSAQRAEFKKAMAALPETARKDKAVVRSLQALYSKPKLAPTATAQPAQRRGEIP